MDVGLRATIRTSLYKSYYGVAKVSKIFEKVILLVMLVVLSTSYSFAQEASKEKKVTNFKDWGRTCDKIPGVEGDVCFLFQRLRMKETEKVVMSTTVAINPKDNKPVISITVPLGMLLPPVFR